MPMAVQLNISIAMESKTIQLRFRAADRNIFESIRKGRKKVETRTASPKFIKIKAGDNLKLICGNDSFNKSVKNAKIFKTISVVLKNIK